MSHPRFDIYAKYLKRFEGAFDPDQGFELVYALQSMRNYAQEKQPDGRTISVPQSKTEGELRLICPHPDEGNIHFLHQRSWSTWTEQPPAVSQDLVGTVGYKTDAIGTLTEWKFQYTSTPVLPVKAFRFNKIGPMDKQGSLENGEVILRDGSGRPPMRQETASPLVSLYSLIERIQHQVPERQQVDLLDDLTMLRKGLTLRPAEPAQIEVEGVALELRSVGLIGPGMMPLFFWLDSESRVVAVLGRNVALTLKEARNFS